MFLKKSMMSGLEEAVEEGLTKLLGGWRSGEVEGLEGRLYRWSTGGGGRLQHHDGPLRHRDGPAAGWRGGGQGAAGAGGGYTGGPCPTGTCRLTQFMQL